MKRIGSVVWTLVVCCGAAPVPEVTVSDIVIPSDIGYVLETHPPTSSAPHPLIVHIQEAHTNYEAQTHLATIIQQLMARHGLKLVLVEGAEGEASLSYLHAFGPLESRQRVAEHYLKTGILSGEEYVSIVSDEPLLLWGVEDQTLYRDNVELFLEAETVREQLTPVMAAVRAAVDQLGPQLFDPALINLQKVTTQFEEGSIEALDYATTLTRLADRVKVSLESFPQVNTFISMRTLQPNIDQAQTEQEQQLLVSRLRKAVSQEALDDLIAQAKGTAQGTVTREAFYLHLRQLAMTSGFRLEDYPHLAHYLSYVEHASRVNPAALANELQVLSNQLREVIASSTPESQALQQIAGELELVERMLALQLSPSEYQQLQLVDFKEACSRWSQFLNAHPTADGWSGHSLGDLQRLQEVFPLFQRFYETTQRRDEVLVQRAVAKVKESREPLAVLITGGFHSPRITQLLQDRGVGVVVVAPKVSQATNDQLYRAVLKYKSGHGTFADVQAAANQGDRI